VVGAWPSLIIAGILFEAAHIPRQMDAGMSPNDMAAFFMLNTLLPAAILATVVSKAGRDPAGSRSRHHGHRDPRVD
jgi:hypothetical protein